MKADEKGIVLEAQFKNIVEYPENDNHFGPLVIHDEHRI